MSSQPDRLKHCWSLARWMCLRYPCSLFSVLISAALCKSDINFSCVCLCACMILDIKDMEKQSPESQWQQRAIRLKSSASFSVFTLSCGFADPLLVKRSIIQASSSMLLEDFTSRISRSLSSTTSRRRLLCPRAPLHNNSRWLETQGGIAHPAPLGPFPAIRKLAASGVCALAGGVPVGE